MRRIGIGVWLLLVLAGCGLSDSAATPRPTFGPILSQGESTAATPEISTAVAPALAPAVPDVATVPVLPSPDSASNAEPLEQYRRWIVEARTTHPYSASADLMWDVMLCESSGDAQAEGPGGLYGLFQYSDQTWNATWNPYRDQPRTDARAQIWATAKAWSDGNEQWWAVCLP